ncbi:MAG: PAS domain-containing sensor histidine kinase [Planctomycetota bacterium]|jgi:signal transduction histidine kinase|nr:PAS domain-containing sensor histidine kinase [Planctomycetota bacterium]
MDNNALGTQDAHPVSGTSDETVRELTRQRHELAEAMQRLIRFQRQTMVLKNSPDIESALDTMESLLIEVIDFAYASLQRRSDEGGFVPLRHLCPEAIPLDPSLMEWVMNAQEVSVLPIDIPMEEEEGRLKSLVYLPFGAEHIMLLWLEQGSDAFTQEQEALLSILSREMASVLDSHHYRARLEKTRAAMSDIIESVPLGILAVDHNEKVQMINSTAEIALDVRRRDVEGAGYRDALPPQLADLIAAAGNSGIIEEAEISVGRPGSDSQFLGVTISPVRSEDGSGKSGHVVVCRNLQLVREVRKLRELDVMKNDFLSLVTHELRTPLTSIMAYSETLILDETESVPKEWREYIDIIHSEGKRLCKLIDDVLDLTRMEAGNMSYSFEAQDPNEIIGIVVMSLTPAIEEKGHDVELDLDENIGDCRLVVDRYTQVLANVISNAIKYTNPGGKIAIRSRKASPFPGSGTPTILVTVEDNGIGIASENLDRVFSKFEMVEAVKNHTAGTGLSMAICKQIIEDGHGGRIWLESEPGAGTRVFIQTPAS